jgi:hypothetical protein
MRKLLLTLAVGMAFPVAYAANSEIDYFGTNLFLGIAYHRWACAFDGPYVTSLVTTNNTYQGFDATQQCYAGWTWRDERNRADIYLGYVVTGNLGDDWLGYYFCSANWDYGLKLNDGSDASDWHNYCHSWQTAYSNNDTFGMNRRGTGAEPNACSYSVIFNCNSDCWISDFSSQQGSPVPIASPCL